MLSDWTAPLIYIKAYSNLMLIEPEVVVASRVFSPSRESFKLQEPEPVEVMMEKSVSLPLMVPLMPPELALRVADLETSRLSR